MILIVEGVVRLRNPPTNVIGGCSIDPTELTFIITIIKSYPAICGCSAHGVTDVVVF